MSRFLDEHTAVIRPPLGLDEYALAVEAFDQALRASPNDAGAARHRYMTLVEQRKWSELRSKATARAATAPWDATSWLARGLASHELQDEPAAAAAFDSALSAMSQREQSRYADLGRILRPADSTSYAHMNAAARQRLSRVFWVTADPSPLIAGNVVRLEFLSRMAYADLRWPSIEGDSPGADADRGQIWVRYGPPGVIASFSPDVFGVNSVADTPPGFGLLLWYYPTLNLQFIFLAPPTYGMARLADRYRTIAEEARLQAPARWVNLPVARTLADSITVQLSRFREGRDSIALVVFARLPVGQLKAPPGGSDDLVSEALSLYSSDGAQLLLDSTTRAVGKQGADGAEVRGWRERVPAVGPALFRVDALGSGRVSAARAMSEVRLLADSGFGVSDLLLADMVSPGAGAAQRWSDFLITPNVGTVQQGKSLALLWETYDLAARGGAASYKVALTLERVQPGGARGVAVRILNGVRGVAGRGAIGVDRVTIAYERTVPARPIAVDYLTLDVGDTAPGSYRLSVDVEDQITGRHVISERTLWVRK
ncbi:MAG: GWxTD domain-containing protein [Gemmatimonadaceae bacterium]